MKLRNTSAAALIGLALGSQQLVAAEFTVTVENLTHGIYFTPLLVAAHGSSTQLFQSGTTASPSLEALAEMGDFSGLIDDVAATSPTLVENPAAGLLAPGESTTTTMISTDGTGNDYLSMVSMMLPTNDGFIGLNSWEIPATAGTYTVTLNAYDAGTEANDELSASIPSPIDFGMGSGGAGVAGQDTNAMVHIHRGSVGDDNSEGGASDLDNRVHRWLNPVARVTVVVQ